MEKTETDISPSGYITVLNRQTWFMSVKNQQFYPDNKCEMLMPVCFWPRIILCVNLKIGSYLTLLLLAIQTSAQSHQRQITLSETDAVYGFYEYLPEAYDEVSDPYPLMIYLHGRGETGNGNSDLWKVKQHGPNRLIEAGRAFPAVILSPQSGSDWDIDSLNTFVEWAFERYNADTARLYITGISMGGAGVWLYAATYPEKVRAIVPISGDAKATNPDRLVDVGVWAFHNEGDHVVEVELTYEWIEGIKQAGGNPKVTIYDQSGHDAWTETYDNEEMWQWMFAQQPDPPPLTVFGPVVENRIYPNPFSSRLNLDLSDQVISAKLYSMKGRMMAIWSSVEQRGTTYAISVGADLSPGIYLLEVKSVHGTQRYKVIKE